MSTMSSISKTSSPASQQRPCLGESIQQLRSISRTHHAAQNVAEEDSISPANPQNQDVSKNEGKSKGVEGDDVQGGEESAQARIERLGRERPKIFSSLWAEIGFVFSIIMSQILAEYFISGFNVILPTLIIELDIPSASSVWPASAFSLVIASTLLVFGRLADMFGGFPVYVAGLAWLTVWSIIAGFSQNNLMLDFCRALQGIGPAAYLPSGVMLMGSVYRPGPRKNLVFSIYGTCAVVGFFVGIFFSGLAGQYLNWGWYFWIGAILSAITLVSAYITIPSDSAEKRRQGIKMDWAGAGLIVPGLVLFVFSITDSSHAPRGWRTPYIYVLLIVGIILLSAAVYVEGWVSKAPLLPFDLFSVPSMKPLVLALLLLYGGLGIYLLYGTLYMENIMGATPLQVVAWVAPMVTGGLILSTVGGFILHLIPGTVLLWVSGVGWIGAGVFFAVAPVGANYWAFVFPSMICSTVGVDITFNITNIFITTNMPSERQGLAGALINSIVHLSIATLLGFADITQASTAHLGLRWSYKAVFWFEVASSALALVIMVLFVKMDRAKSDLTADEKRELEMAAKSEGKVGANG